jgi:xanthine dehydrogenase large subunit
MKQGDPFLHSRGESQYIDDVPQPSGMLYGAVFSATVAHARIISLDLTQALAQQGVVRIFTFKDIPGQNEIGPIIKDETLLAEDEVHFIGDPVAFVVADTYENAHKAVNKINIQTETLEIITDPREACRKGQIIGIERTFVLGDVDSCWQKCAVVVEGSCNIAGQEHVYLETQRARAIPVEKDGLCVFSSTQSPYAVQRTVAGILGIPHHKIEVDVKRLGGGFGGKEDQATAWACLPALAAWLLKKPVELVLSRHDDIKMTGKRHPYVSDFKIGLSKDGKILAYQASHYQNAGAAADLSSAVLERTLFHSTNSYYIPNVKIFGVSCRTNLPPNTAFRGFGGPQGMFVIECAIAKAARHMGMTKEVLQAKNLLKDKDTFPYGQIVENGHSIRTWNEAEKKYNYPAIKKHIDDFNNSHFDRKKGLSMMPVCFGISFTGTFLNQAGALVHIYTDGSVSVSMGGVEMGQGLAANISSIAATVFGISDKRVKVETTNTTRVANMSASAASATTDLNGHATRLAIEQILERLKAFIIKEFKLTANDIVSIRDEQIFCNDQKMEWDWQKLIQAAYLNRIGLSAHGFYATPGIWFDKVQEKGHPFAYHVYGTAITEVTLDCLRGTYDIDAIRIVHDLGRPINELVDRGQIEGGLAQGLGWMTLEELKFDATGRYLSNSLATYKVPDVYFMPDILEIELLEDAYNPSGALGSKAVGEPPLMYGIGVFFAIQNAMQAFRPQSEFAYDCPLTPEKVLMQLHKKELEKMSAKKTSNQSPEIVSDHEMVSSK